MMDETAPMGRSAIVQRLLQGIEHEAGVCRPDGARGSGQPDMALQFGTEYPGRGSVLRSGDAASACAVGLGSAVPQGRGNARQHQQRANREAQGQRFSKQQRGGNGSHYRRR